MYTELKKFGKVKLNEPLAKHTTFKIGGPAEAFVIVEQTQKLVDLLKHLDGEGIPYFILGGGSNMLAADEVFEGVVIKVKTSAHEVQGDTLICDAGCNTVAMAQSSMKAGLAGFEWGVGVPGTIGGAVRGNAGAMGGEMQDRVEKVEAYVDGEVTELSGEECKFDYRSSRFKKSGGVVLRIWLRLEAGNPDVPGMKKAIEHLQYRNSTQPQGFASTGCIFKNPDFEKNKDLLLKHFEASDEKVKGFADVGKISAGWLVEQAGMKGERVGGAQVSERHGNFIVSVDGASAKDVLELIELVKVHVLEKIGVELEEEVALLR